MRRRRDSGKAIRQLADRGWQYVLEIPANARGLVTVLASDLAERLDFARMERVPAKAVAEDLHLREGDLVLRIPFRNPDPGGPDELLVCLLVEHQSTVDLEIPARVVYAMGSVWDQQRHEWSSRRTPAAQRRLLPVIPILLYDGDERWDTPLAIAAMMDLPGMLARFVPQFDILVLKVRWADRDELVRSRHPFAWLLRAIQELDAPFDELVSVLRETMGPLEALAGEDRVAWERVLTFLYYLVGRSRAEEERGVLVDEMAAAVQATTRRQEAVTMAKTIWDAAVEEGIEEGIEKGREEGIQRGREEGMDLGLAEGLVRGAIQAKQESVLLLLAERFGPVPDTVAERVRSIQDPGVLDDLMRQAVHADSLEALGL